LNPLAVELAKLSLWLTTIATDQPLNFLDHHLCCGNSLIGARLEDLGRVPERKRKGADSLKLSWKITENLRAALTGAVQMVHRIAYRLYGLTQEENPIGETELEEMKRRRRLDAQFPSEPHKAANGG